MEKLIVAHRGAKALSKFENTLESFQIAIDIHSDMVEFDVRKTKDNKLIVFHNDHINNILLNTLTYYELNEITQKEGYTVPLYEDVLILCQHKIRLDIEIKESGFEEEIIATTLKYCGLEEFTMKSFLDIVVKKIKIINPAITAGLLIGYEHANILTRLGEIFPHKRLKKCHADFISPNYRHLKFPLFVSSLNLYKMPIYVWTVNDEELMNALLSKNITGIITDRPDLALKLRSELDKQ